MRDPMRAPPGAGNTGSAALARPESQRWEQGTVVVYNSDTHTAVVRTNRGRPLQDVPQLKPSSGAFEHLATGTSVVVSWDLGWPIIVGCIDDVGLPQTAIPSMPLTGVEGVGSADPTQPTRGTNNYKPPNAPNDMGPGDFARVGTMGNHIGILEGGLSLFGSPTAQLRSMGTTGAMHTIARTLQQITDFGQVNIENNQGKTSLVLRAGSNQTTETGLDEQHWTIRLDLGATGDMFDFKILEPEGKVLFRMHVGSDGRVQIFGGGGVDLSSGKDGAGDMRSDHAGPRTVVIDGDDTRSIAGVEVSTIDQSSSHTVGGDATRAIGGALTEFSSGNRAIGTGGDETDVVGGKRSTSIGGNDDTEIDGEWSVLAKKSVRLSADGDFVVRARGKAQLNGRKVVLGATGNHPLPKFDVFLRDFGQFLNTLMGSLANCVPINPYAVAANMAQLAFYSAKINSGFLYKSTTVKND